LSGPRSASRREFRSPPRFLGAGLFNPRFLPPTPLRTVGAFPTSPRDQICQRHDLFSPLASSNPSSPFASPPFRIYNPPN